MIRHHEPSWVLALDLVDLIAIVIVLALVLVVLGMAARGLRRHLQRRP
jgi:hypothetical protein